MRIIRGIKDSPISPIVTEHSGVEREERWEGDVGAAVSDILRTHAPRIWVYFAEHDDWVGDKGRVDVYRALKEGGGAFNAGNGLGAGEAVFGSGVPHDFCISECCVYLMPYSWLLIHNLKPPGVRL